MVTRRMRPRGQDSGGTRRRQRRRRGGICASALPAADRLDSAAHARASRESSLATARESGRQRERFRFAAARRPPWPVVATASPRTWRTATATYLVAAGTLAEKKAKKAVWTRRIAAGGRICVSRSAASARRPPERTCGGRARARWFTRWRGSFEPGRAPGGRTRLVQGQAQCNADALLLPFQVDLSSAWCPAGRSCPVQTERRRRNSRPIRPVTRQQVPPAFWC